MIDLFATEYGWTVTDTLDLTSREVALIQKAIEHRYDLQDKAMKTGKRDKKDNVDRSSPKKTLESVLGKYKDSVVEG